MSEVLTHQLINWLGLKELNIHKISELIALRFIINRGVKINGGLQGFRKINKQGVKISGGRGGDKI